MFFFCNIYSKSINKIYSCNFHETSRLQPETIMQNIPMRIRKDIYAFTDPK